MSEIEVSSFVMKWNIIEGIEWAYWFNDYRDAHFNSLGYYPIMEGK